MLKIKAMKTNLPSMPSAVVVQIFVRKYLIVNKTSSRWHTKIREQHMKLANNKPLVNRSP
jgi:hypothetical protein